MQESSALSKSCETLDQTTDFSSKNTIQNAPEKLALDDVNATTHHYWSEEETSAYVDWINSTLGQDEELANYLPISKKGTSLFMACNDGVVLAKLVNRSFPGTIDETTIARNARSPIYKSENLMKVLNGCKAAGIQVHNIGPQDILNKIPHLCLGLVWQVIKMGLLSNVQPVEGASPVTSNESLSGDATKKTSNEKSLLQWFNKILIKSGCPVEKVKNFGVDLSDSVALAYLVNWLSPEDVDQLNFPAVIQEPKMLKRAEMVLAAADEYNCRQFTSPEGIVSGNKNLNLAFVANLYNNRALASETERRTRDLEEQLENLEVGAEKLALEKELAETALKISEAKSKSKLSRLESKLNHVEAARNDAESEVSALIAEIARLKTLLEELSQENSDNKYAKLAALDQIEDLSRTVKDLTAQKLKNEAELSKLNHEISELKNEAAKHAVQQAADQARMAEKLADAQKLLAKLEAEKAETTRSLEDLRGEVSYGNEARQNEANDHKKQIQAQQNEVDRLLMEKKIIELEKQSEARKMALEIAAEQHEINMQLQMDLMNAQQKNQAQEEELREAKREQEKERDFNMMMLMQNRDLEHALLAVNERLHEQQADNESMKETQQYVEETIFHVQDQNAALNSKLEEAAQKLQEQEAALEEAKKAASAVPESEPIPVNDDYARLEESLRDISKMLADKTNESSAERAQWIKAMQEKMNELTKQSSARRMAIEVAAGEMNQKKIAEAKLEEERQKVAALEKELADLKRVTRQPSALSFANGSARPSQAANIRQQSFNNAPAKRASVANETGVEISVTTPTSARVSNAYPRQVSFNNASTRTSRALPTASSRQASFHNNAMQLKAGISPKASFISVESAIEAVKNLPVGDERDTLIESLRAKLRSQNSMLEMAADEHIENMKLKEGQASAQENESTVAGLKEELANLNKQVDDLKSKLNDSQKLRVSTVANSTRLSKQSSMFMTEQDATIKDLREKLAASEQKRIQINYQIEVSTAKDLQNRDLFLQQINRAQQALRESDAQMDCLRKRLAFLEQEKEIFNQKLGDINTKLLNSKADYDRQQRAILDEVSEKNTTILSLQEKIDALNSQDLNNVDISSSSQQDRATLNELKQRDAAAQAEIKALNGRVQSLIEARDTLANKVVTVDITYVDKTRQFNSAINDIEQELNRRLAQVSELKEKVEYIEKCERERDALVEQKSAINEKCAKAEEELSLSNLKNDELRSEAESLKAILNRLEAENNLLQLRIRSIKTSEVILRDECLSAFVNSEKIIREKNAIIEKLDAKVDQYRHQTNAVCKAFETPEVDSEENSALQQELARLTEQLKELENVGEIDISIEIAHRHADNLHDQIEQIKTQIQELNKIQTNVVDQFAPGNAEQLALIKKLQGKLDLLERMALGRKRAIEVAALESVERARLTNENQIIGYKYDEAYALNEFLNKQLKVYKSGEDMRELQKEYDTFRSTSLLNLAKSRELLPKSNDSAEKSDDSAEKSNDSVAKSNESVGASDDSAIGSAEDVSKPVDAKKQKKIDQKSEKVATKARKAEEKAARKSAKSVKDFTPIPAN